MTERKYGPKVDKLSVGDATGWTVETLNDHIYTLESLRDITGKNDGLQEAGRLHRSHKFEPLAILASWAMKS